MRQTVPHPEIRSHRRVRRDAASGIRRLPANMRKFGAIVAETAMRAPNFEGVGIRGGDVGGGGRGLSSAPWQTCSSAARSTRQRTSGRPPTTSGNVNVPTDSLTTHGVIVGMTGSGKTGLGVILIEEALRAGLPVLAIDPKGDLTNLCLTFPDLSPADFRPWIDEAQAKNAGETPDDFAAEPGRAVDRRDWPAGAWPAPTSARCGPRPTSRSTRPARRPACRSTSSGRCRCRPT